MLIIYKQLFIINYSSWLQHFRLMSIFSSRWKAAVVAQELHVIIAHETTALAVCLSHAVLYQNGYTDQKKFSIDYTVFWEN